MDTVPETVEDPDAAAAAAAEQDARIPSAEASRFLAMVSRPATALPDMRRVPAWVLRGAQRPLPVLALDWAAVRATWLGMGREVVQ